MIQWFSAIKKEWLEAIRDKRSIAMALIIPIMMPAMMGGVIGFLIEKESSSSFDVAVVNSHLAPDMLPHLAGERMQIEALEPGNYNPEELLEEYDAVLIIDEDFSSDLIQFSPATSELWFNSSQSTSNGAARQLRAKLGALSRQLTQQRMTGFGVPTVAMRPIAIVSRDTAKPGSRAAIVLGSMPGMIIFAAFACALATAIDTTSGERERLSLEPLLVQPASTWLLMCSKWSVVTAFGWIGAALTAVLLSVVMSLLPLQELGISWQVSYSALAMVCFQLLPVAMFAGALMLLVALKAKSFKEAQTLLGILQIAPLVGLMAIDLSDKVIEQELLLIPFVSQQQIIKASFSADASFDLWAWGGVAITVALALGVLALASRSLNKPHRLLS
ncbi:ABC transporter permease [Umboniibacter marinipuniceus]|uniref:Sodium transport system permease protein n=1 Tax=Umboniibacter marinipuniceus TaxID=569599 RepID=A0A3M0A3L3_9GAMM|nr:ABC transporter permease subunit [Umboniibacter marinipuniceus]RMA79410.1 sodium transport system permease protein [Umboniibacter marinipuniceus]